MKPLLVGEAPAKGSKEPLGGRSGRFLAKLLGMGMGGFLDAFDRANLLRFRQRPSAGKGDLFDLALASANARRMGLRGRDVLLLGKRVALAFGLKDPAWLRPVRLGKRERAAFVLPHPTGINRWWNDGGNRALATGLLSSVLGGATVRGKPWS